MPDMTDSDADRGRMDRADRAGNESLADLPASTRRLWESMHDDDVRNLGALLEMLRTGYSVADLKEAVAFQRKIKSGSKFVQWSAMTIGSVMAFVAAMTAAVIPLAEHMGWWGFKK